MKSRIHLVLAGLALAAIAACSSNICSQSSANSSYATKLNACYANADGGVSLHISTCSDQTACEKNLSSCSSQDQTVMQNLINCENAYTGGCTASDLAVVTGCQADAGTLSAACATAFVSNPGSCGADGG